MERFPESLKVQEEEPSRLSSAYISSQLYHLATSAEYIAQSILFLFIVMAQENFKQIDKRFFKITESETGELLADIIERFEAACSDFGLRQLSDGLTC